MVVEYCDVEGTEYCTSPNMCVDPVYVNQSAGDLRLKPRSPANNEGNDALVQLDWPDIDEDMNITEQMPWDLSKSKRIINIVEIGAYESCIGDVDGDLDTDISDLAIVLGCYGQSPCIGTCCESDFDEDGDVDISDLSLMLSNYGYDCKPETGEGLTGGGDSLLGGDDPTTEWIRNATVEDIIRWWEAGMPPIGDDSR